MRRALFVSGLILGVLLCTAGPALAEHVPWLSVSPPFARPGDTVVFTITGPPGYDAALAYSFSSLGFGQLNGQHVLLGPDLTVLASGTIGPDGAWTSSVTIPPGVPGEVFLQGAVWPSGTSAMTLTNGSQLFIVPAGGNGIGIAHFTLRQAWDPCRTGFNNEEFRAVIAAFQPVREVTMQTPGGATYQMEPYLARVFGPTLSGYPYAFWYFRQGAGTLALFGDGTYTFTATFPDGTTATTSTVLGGSFPSEPIISLACGETISRGPTISFTRGGASDATIGVWPSGTGVGDIWEYAGTATSVTMPSNFLRPSTTYGIGVEAHAPSATAARKAAHSWVDVRTAP